MRVLMAGEGGNGSGGGAPDWRAALPEALRDAPPLKDVPDVPTLAKNFVESMAYRGQSVRFVGPDASPEARKEQLEKIAKHYPEVFVAADEKAQADLADWKGRPKEAKEYAAPGVELPESALDALRAEAAEEGLTKAQFQARAKRAAAAAETAQRAARAEAEALKKELGPAYQDRIAGAAEAARKLGADADEVKAIESGSAPVAYVRRMLAAAKALGASREVADQNGGARTTMTPAEAAAQRAEIRGRKEFWDRSLNPALAEQLRAKDLELAKIQFGE